MNSIPVLDLAPWLAGGERAPLVEKFRHAYGEVGFGYIIGHGIDPALTSDMFAASRAFHAMPIADKLALKADRTHRGYIPIDTSTDRTSTLAKVTKPNQSASLMIMREDPGIDPDVYLSGPNKWPDLPGFRNTVERYQSAMCTLARQVLDIAIEAAGITDTHILKAFDTPTTWLRLLHYPPQPAASPDDLFGSAPHTDFGALTLLAQDPVGGLQVMTTDGAWIDAPFMDGAFVVNVGDMLHRLSNARLRSTPHRVINRSGRERYSVPFFFDPHVHTLITPQPGTGTPEYEPIRFDAFLRHELESSYDAHATGST